jgi:hypothetical protein
MSTQVFSAFTKCLRFLLPMVGALCFADSALAQTTIHERLTISPRARNLRTTQTEGHTITFSMHWTSSQGSDGGRMCVYTPCSLPDQPDLFYNAPGTFSVTTSYSWNSRGGVYTLQPQLHTSDNDLVSIWTSVSIDGVEVAADSSADLYTWSFGFRILPGGCGFNHTAGFFSSFAFDAGVPAISYGSSQLLNINPFQDCGASSQWYPTTDSVNIEIVHGGEFGTFHRQGGDTASLGTSIRILENDIQAYDYIADGILPEITGSKVVIEASAGSIVARDSFLVTRGFMVSLSPDTMAHGDTSTIWVTATFPFSDLESINISVDSARFGSFIDASGNLVGSSFWTDFGNARLGRIKYVANGAIDSTASKLLVIKAEQAPKSGAATLILQEKFELILEEPTENSTTLATISTSPTMPTLVARARVAGRGSSSVAYTWKLHLRWDYHTRGGTGSLTDSFEQTLIVNNADTCRWQVPWGAKTRGGLLDTLMVSATCRGQTVETQRNKPYRILGLNPSPSQIRAGQSIEMQVVLYIESTFRQFQPNDSTPLWTNSAGYGVAQIDPPTSPEQYWNWVVNRAAGVQKLSEAQTNAAQYGQRLRNNKKKKHVNATDLTADQQIYDSFQQYQGQHYWYWYDFVPRDPNSLGEWRANPPILPGTNEAYGHKAYRYRQDVIAGRPPWTN